MLMLPRRVSPIGGVPPGPTNPSGFLWDYNAGTDTLVYDSDTTFAAVTTIPQLISLRDSTIGGATPYAIYAPPIDTADMEATASFVAGYDGRPRALRFTLPGSVEEVKIKYELFRDSGLSYRFNPSGTYLIVQMALAFNLPQANFEWWKGLEMRNSSDRVQYGAYNTGDSLYWGNVNPGIDYALNQVYFGQPAITGNPSTYYTWAEITGAGFLVFTHVYKQNTTMGVTNDGVSKYYVGTNPLVDVSLSGLATGWLADRRYQTAASSTSPYPGNVGEKNATYGGSPAANAVTLTGATVLSQWQSRLTTGLAFPDIVKAAGSATGTIDVGRMLVYYRSA